MRDGIRCWVLGSAAVSADDHEAPLGKEKKGKKKELTARPGTPFRHPRSDLPGKLAASFEASCRCSLLISSLPRPRHFFVSCNVVSSTTLPLLRTLLLGSIHPKGASQCSGAKQSSFRSPCPPPAAGLSSRCQSLIQSNLAKKPKPAARNSASWWIWKIPEKGQAPPI